MLPVHRLLLPFLHQLDASRDFSSSSSSRQLGSRLIHTQPPPPPTHVSQLTDEQRQELKHAVVGSFKQDPQAASKLLAKSLSDDAKRQLLAALEASQGPPELSRAAMVDTPDNHHTSTAAAAVTAAAAARPDKPGAEAPQEVPEPSFKQLLRVGITKGLPFVAFGFFDNLIMITAGEQIDLMFGAKLGLSSMMAAGLGNTVADVVGINISHTIERKFKDAKSMVPQLTKAQLALPRTQRAKWLGCAIGMASGCLLGLTPLFFYDTPSQSSEGSSTGASRQATAAA